LNDANDALLETFCQCSKELELFKRPTQQILLGLFNFIVGVLMIIGFIGGFLRCIYPVNLGGFWVSAWVSKPYILLMWMTRLLNIVKVLAIYDCCRK